jgi:repressor LexA
MRNGTDPEGVAAVDLTKRQQEIFDFIKRYAEEFGYPPTVRDIGKAVGLASSSTVHAHLANLEKLGLVRRDPTKPRALELLDRAASGVRSLVDQAGAGLPLVGQVAAGAPLLAEENIEEYVPTPQVAGGEDGEYLLRIRGESMRNAGILDGDLVVVCRQDSARDGEIVVALVGEEAEATVKRFFQESDHIRLQPENDSMAPILSREVTVIGRVVGLMRSI